MPFHILVHCRFSVVIIPAQTSFSFSIISMPNFELMNPVDKNLQFCYFSHSFEHSSYFCIYFFETFLSCLVVVFFIFLYVIYYILCHTLVLFSASFYHVNNFTSCPFFYFLVILEKILFADITKASFNFFNVKFPFSFSSL